MSDIAVLILMGSDSDAPVMQAAVDVLREFQIPCEMTVASAHRSPERVMRLVGEAPGRGVRVFIVGAGAAAHLAGVVAAHTTLPVIGVPIDSSALKGLDALLSTVQMPPGVPVATVSIGSPGATNAGVLAAQILAVGDPAMADRLAAVQAETRTEGRGGGGQAGGCAGPLRVSPAARRRRRALCGLGPFRARRRRRDRDPHMRYSIVTFGCRVNQADSLRIEEDLRTRGGVQCAPEDADVVVVNTCSVTASADQGARQAIRRIARVNAGARVVVTGCYATRAASEVGGLAAEVRVVRNRDKERLVSDLLGETTAARYGAGEGACGAALEPGLMGRTAFTLRVQTGCEERCAYCIIPATRGRGRSLPIDAVLREVRRVAASGFREVAVTGVHLGSYGRDLQPAVSLRDLLCALQEAGGDLVFRVSSLEPMDCTAEIVELIAASGGRFAPHFHLPLQHASDRMLERMRRPYTAADYRRTVDAILDRLPHASIGSDLIVGFPGETDRDFGANLEYLPGSGLTHLHVFPYSDRPGTAATAMGDKVDGAVIRERGAKLRGIGADLSRRFRASQSGSVRPGLTLEDGTLVVTDNFLKLRIAPGLRRNERVVVRVGDGVAEVVRVASVRAAARPAVPVLPSLNPS